MRATTLRTFFLYTKMRNVAGISQTDAQKSSDMFMKCRYMDELTGGRGITFATGTPVSNSMTELYTIMRYLQYDTLMRMGMGHFDYLGGNVWGDSNRNRIITGRKRAIVRKHGLPVFLIFQS